MTSSPLRVLYSFPHPLGAPGINTTAWHQVVGLAKLNVDVTVVCTTLARPLPPGIRVIETLRLFSRRIPHRAIGLRRAYAYHDWHAAALLTSAPSRFDVVHSWPRACLRTAEAGKRAGVPVLREVPSAFTATAFEDAARASAAIGLDVDDRSSHRFSPRRLAEENREFRSVDGLLVPSEYVRSTFVTAGWPAESLHRHQYGYDPAVFYPSDRVAERPLRAVFVGRGEPAKGLHLAVQAWRTARLPDGATLRVAGHVQPELLKYLGTHQRDSSIQYLGFVNDVAALLRDSDVLLFPSYTEGSALAVLEAMACGVVPLVSRVSGSPVTDGLDGLLHHVGDAQTLTEQLSWVAADRALLSRMRTAALASSTDLTWDAAADALFACYRQTAS